MGGQASARTGRSGGHVGAFDQASRKSKTVLIFAACALARAAVIELARFTRIAIVALWAYLVDQRVAAFCARIRRRGAARCARRDCATAPALIDVRLRSHALRRGRRRAPHFACGCGVSRRFVDRALFHAREPRGAIGRARARRYIAHARCDRARSAGARRKRFSPCVRAGRARRGGCSGASGRARCKHGERSARYEQPERGE